MEIKRENIIVHLDDSHQKRTTERNKDSRCIKTYSVTDLKKNDDIRTNVFMNVNKQTNKQTFLNLIQYTIYAIKDQMKCRIQVRYLGEILLLASICAYSLDKQKVCRG